MQLDLLTLDTQVRRFASAAQASASRVLDFTRGSLFLALAEAQAALGLWFQWLLLRVLATTRLATSTDTDVDTWVADWGLVRLPAVAATGQVTLSRRTPTLAALVLPGAQVKTVDGSQIFTVSADSSNAAWSTTFGAQPGYLIPAGQASLPVPVQAATAGAGGNVGAGTITVLASAIAGVDMVTNPVAFTGGLDAESDGALRARFAAYIGALSKATGSAILYAAGAVQQGLALQIVENSPRSGMFKVYVDDGSGSPSNDLRARVYAAVDAVRPAGVTFTVQPPAAVSVSIAATLAYQPGADIQGTEAAVSTALAAFVGVLGIADDLDYFETVAVAQAAAAPAARLATLTLNSGTVTIPAGDGQRIRATSVTVS